MPCWPRCPKPSCCTASTRDACFRSCARRWPRAACSASSPAMWPRRGCWFQGGRLLAGQPIGGRRAAPGHHRAVRSGQRPARLHDGWQRHHHRTHRRGRWHRPAAAGPGREHQGVPVRHGRAGPGAAGLCAAAAAPAAPGALRDPRRPARRRLRAALRRALRHRARSRRQRGRGRQRHRDHPHARRRPAVRRRGRTPRHAPERRGCRHAGQARAQDARDHLAHRERRTRRRSLLQVREPAAHGRVQRTRQVQPRAAPRWRGRVLVGQPRPGHGAGRAAAGHAGHHRHAARRARRQGRGHQGLWRPGCHVRPLHRRP